MGRPYVDRGSFVCGCRTISLCCRLEEARSPRPRLFDQRRARRAAVHSHEVADVVVRRRVIHTSGGEYGISVTVAIASNRQFVLARLDQSRRYGVRGLHYDADAARAIIFQFRARPLALNAQPVSDESGNTATT